MASRWEPSVSAAAAQSRTSNARRPASAQFDGAKGLVNRACSAEMAVIEHEPLRPPWRKVWRSWKRRQRSPFAPTSAGEREMRLELPRLWFQPCVDALGLDLRCQIGGLLRA